ncbi:MAG: HAD-IIIA family hydrolase [Bacteroidales bacterium]|nr:HAD-IIIA family hydrolase [Bacteroidota bacterium]MBL6949249.1 HAD-IIIA family hydrolase [Bacteroidales bacterium]
MSLSSLQIDKEWSLFLDRDGVLNERIVDGYVTRWEEFNFLPDVLEAMKVFDELFGRIVVVSNQQGIGKEIMTEGDVVKVHEKLEEQVKKNGGRIDSIYFSPHLAKEGNIMRKPNVGMALKARRDFPEIRFRLSVMAGDKLSDMVFGRRLGMKTVFISDNIRDLRKGHKLIDFAFPDLQAFASHLNQSH